MFTSLVEFDFRWGVFEHTCNTTECVLQYTCHLELVSLRTSNQPSAMAANNNYVRPKHVMRVAKE